MTRVLVIDDERAILRTLGINLSVRGYDVVTASTGQSGLNVAAEERPDAVIVDLTLPDTTGVEVINGLRSWTTVPIIVLSARTDSSDKVRALDAGADDYVTKPFGMDELLARLRAALRRAAAPSDTAEPVVEAASFTVDLVAKTVTRRGAEIHMTQPSGACSRFWCAIVGGSSDAKSCCASCGVQPPDRTRSITFGCTLHSYDANSRTTRHALFTCSPNPVWAIDSRCNPLRRSRQVFFAMNRRNSGHAITRL